MSLPKPSNDRIPNRWVNKLIPLGYSCQEVEDRMANGLCIFCDDQDSPTHQLQKHKNLRIVIVESDDDDIQLFDEQQVPAAKSYIQHVSETNTLPKEEAIPEEDTIPKKTMMMENPQETESKEVWKPIQPEEIDGLIQEDESPKANEARRETYSDPQSQEKRGGADLTSYDGDGILVNRPLSGVSVWKCSKLCAVFFVAGVFVGYTFKRRARRWASKLLRRIKDD